VLKRGVLYWFLNLSLTESLVTETLLVIGGGPRALAIHARAKVLRDLGMPSPSTSVLEQYRVGANWFGSHGYTNGHRRLVTSPEKDLGYPYDSSEAINQELLRYSWQAFLTSQNAFANWVDQGRPHPTHREFSNYLEWAARKTSFPLVLGRVEEGSIVETDGAWAVSYRNAQSKRVSVIRASSLVITGPGDARRLVDGQPKHPNISDAVSFWAPRRLSDFNLLPSGPIAVIGSGDTAASVVVTLLELMQRRNIEIHLFCRSGIPHSRAESSGEQKVLSDPGAFRWSELPVAERLEFLNRSERGVFSSDLKRIIDQAPNVALRPEMVRSASMEGKLVRLGIQTKRGSSPSVDLYHRVVIATGFRRWIFQRWFADQSRFPIIDEKRRRDRWENDKELQLAQLVEPDLSLKCLKRAPGTGTRSVRRPKIYVPALGALNCGPGFSSLACLGRMAEVVIDSHLGSV
jgi:mycobactin lysine-N-oxygenase